MQVAVTCSLTASLKGARISSMLPSMVVIRSAAGSSHDLTFFFLQKRADVENGRFPGGWRSDWRTKRTVDGREEEEILAPVLSSADAALRRRSMDRRREWWNPQEQVNAAAASGSDQHFRHSRKKLKT